VDENRVLVKTNELKHVRYEAESEAC
jgi:hypothetical protein